MAYIKKIRIENFKCFKGVFELELNAGINIIVGNNEAGKSTILEAIHLALTNLIGGRYIKNELSQYLFNKDIESEYIESVNNKNPVEPPKILIEVYFSDGSYPEFEGDDNSDRSSHAGVSFKIEFDESYKSEYQEIIKEGLTTIPIEYYRVILTSFSRETITTRNVPIKPVLIDSSTTRLQNGSDVYISRIIKDDLSDKETVNLSQAYRKLKESFMQDGSIESINNKLSQNANITDKKVIISVDLSSKNSWETTLMTYINEIPFHQIGKGEQCLIKTNLALAHKKAKESNLLLIEEPENHLSHTKLNMLIKAIQARSSDKQVIITTHSSFVANKLNLQNLILLSEGKKTTSLNTLSQDTFNFFQKLSGYETLRMLLAKKTILVEGPSDELIVQRAYMDKHEGKLPIENEIDVISVGLSFKRFLEIASKLEKRVAVMTDNDGNYDEKVEKKYADFNQFSNIRVFADKRIQLNTLEPQLVDANKDILSDFCGVTGISYTKYNDFSSISEYMQDNKTKCALSIFSSKNSINYPDYINKLIQWCDED